jgi:hypothetical protein
LDDDLGPSGSPAIRQLNPRQHEELNSQLSRYGIELTEEVPNDLVKQIKRAVIEMIRQEEGLPKIKYLAISVKHSIIVTVI